MKIARALISVWDKTGVLDFAKALHGMGVEILSTGGTAKAMRDAGIPVKDVSEFTGFPELLDGRVKTLHPKVHAGILHIRGNAEHEATMAKHGLQAIDLVCVNLYPFEATVAKPGVTREVAIENIDIGGPTMLRSSAKNMDHVTVVTDPADYGRVLESMGAHGGGTTLELRRELGFKVFARTAEYDAAISAWLAAQGGTGDGAPPFVKVATGGVKLRYGENPHQAAVFYRDPSCAEASIAHTRVLHGKEMSFNNYLDGESALETAKEFAGTPAVVIIKHNNPCGCATAPTLAEAFDAAWAGDPVSAFGSVIAVTQPLDLTTAERLKGRFVEALIAPGFVPDALEFLKKKSKDLRILELEKPVTAPGSVRQYRQIGGGLLVQDRDAGAIQHWVVPTAAPFPEDKRKLAEFGVRVCKHVKSNAIVLVRERTPGCHAVLGMGAGQPNRVDSVGKLAVPRAQENIKLLYEATGGYGKTPGDFAAEVMAGSILISDAFFPFPDNIEQAAQAGVKYIVQPGGSVRDEAVISACDRFGIAMAFTGMRHFLH
jgi:phosphoribosylaminoimidazolecarboxamide formyltransferase/IMP cyclohydrolase